MEAILSLTRTLFGSGPLNLGLFTVYDTPSHSICPLSYSHHGLLVSDTPTKSFDLRLHTHMKLDDTHV